MNEQEQYERDEMLVHHANGDHARWQARRGAHGQIVCPLCRLQRWGLSMRQFADAMRKVGLAMTHVNASLRGLTEAFLPGGSWQSKRLRHGRVRTRYVPLRSAQPQPWKVSR